MPLAGMSASPACWVAAQNAVFFHAPLLLRLWHQHLCRREFLRQFQLHHPGCVRGTHRRQRAAGPRSADLHRYPPGGGSASHQGGGVRQAGAHRQQRLDWGQRRHLPGRHHRGQQRHRGGVRCHQRHSGRRGGGRQSLPGLAPHDGRGAGARGTWLTQKGQAVPAPVRFPDGAPAMPPRLRRSPLFTRAARRRNACAVP